jgi:hypothetical protein
LPVGHDVDVPDPRREFLQRSQRELEFVFIVVSLGGRVDSYPSFFTKVSIQQLDKSWVGAVHPRVHHINGFVTWTVIQEMISYLKGFNETVILILSKLTSKVWMKNRSIATAVRHRHL